MKHYKILKEIQKSFHFVNPHDDSRVDEKVFIKAIKFLLNIIEKMKRDPENFKIVVLDPRNIVIKFIGNNYKLRIDVNEGKISWTCEVKDVIDFRKEQIGTNSSDLIRWLNKHY